MEDSYETQGFRLIRQLLSSAERRAILAHERSGRAGNGVDWYKAKAAADPFYGQLVSQEKFLSLLRPVLGPDIIQWGLHIVERGAGAVHPWHCDIESSAPEGGFASLWIGLENTSQKSTLKFVARSHLFGRTVQEEIHRHGMRRGQAMDRRILSWARAIDPLAELNQPALRNGDALLYDGRLWHGSRNRQRWFHRKSILIQYARADKAVRMFDPERIEWPIGVREAPLPPVLVVAGAAPPAINRIVPAPVDA